MVRVAIELRGTCGIAVSYDGRQYCLGIGNALLAPKVARVAPGERLAYFDGKLKPRRGLAGTVETDVLIFAENLTLLDESLGVRLESACAGLSFIRLKELHGFPDRAERRVEIARGSTRSSDDHERRAGLVWRTRHARNADDTVRDRDRLIE